MRTTSISPFDRATRRGGSPVAAVNRPSARLGRTCMSDVHASITIGADPDRVRWMATFTRIHRDGLESLRSRVEGSVRAA